MKREAFLKGAIASIPSIPTYNYTKPLSTSLEIVTISGTDFRKIHNGKCINSR